MKTLLWVVGTGSIAAAIYYLLKDNDGVKDTLDRIKDKASGTIDKVKGSLYQAKGETTSAMADLP